MSRGERVHGQFLILRLVTKLLPKILFKTMKWSGLYKLVRNL